jgi:methyl-accepting chemotaxis protein
VALLGLVTVAGTVFSAREMQNIDHQYRALIDGPAKAAVKLGRARRAMLETEFGISHVLMTLSEDANRRVMQQMAADRKMFAESMAAVQEALPAKRSAIDAIIAQADSILDERCAKAIRLGSESTTNEGNLVAQAEFLQSCETAFRPFIAALNQLTDEVVAENDKDSAATTLSTSKTIAMSYGTILGGLALSLGVAFWVSRQSISQPIRALTKTMERLAAGDLTAEIDGTERKDEIGLMSQAVEIFKKNAEAVKRLEAEQATLKENAERERKDTLMRLADGFERDVNAVVRLVSAGSTQISAAAKQMSDSAEETTRQSASVASAAEQSAANAQTVNAATEELTASVSEISAQVGNASSMAQSAVKQAEETRKTVDHLSEAAGRIGAVIALIQDIASQTNLLALNATIEAARAGEAGKGFSVVASEVKQLASQTANATEEIGQQIAQIQDTTRRTVSAINAISVTISDLSHVSTTIAAAVEEQSAATAEISRTIVQTSATTEEISSNIEGVREAAAQTGSASAEVEQASGTLSAEAEKLRVQVDNFLATLRAA